MENKLKRPFSLNPVQVVPNESPWLTDYSIPTWQIFALLYLEPQPNQKWISFGQAFRLRWLEAAKPDSKNRYFLMHGRSIRTPLHQWCRERNYYCYFLPEEICFPHETRLPL